MNIPSIMTEMLYNFDYNNDEKLLNYFKCEEIIDSLNQDILNYKCYPNTFEIIECVCVENDNKYYDIILKFNNILLRLITDLNNFCNIKFAELQSYDNKMLDLDIINSNIIFNINAKKFSNILKILSDYNNIVKSNYKDLFHFTNKIDTKTKYKLNLEVIKQNSKKFFENNTKKVNIPKELLLNQQQIFSLLLIEIEKVNNNFDYSHYIFPYEDNIYDLRLRIFFNSNIETLKYIEFKIVIDSKLYPFYPPKVDIIYPKLKFELSIALMNLDIFKLENWNSTISLEWFAINIHKLLEPIIYDNIDSNNLEITPIETLLLNLANMTKTIFSKSIQLKFPKMNFKNENIKKQFWKAGTGYGTQTDSTWCIKDFIKEKELLSLEIKKILTLINNEIKSTNEYNIIINNSCLFDYITDSIVGINLLSIEKDKILIEQTFELINTLFEYDDINSEFKKNIILNLSNINDEIISLFQNNEESQGDYLLQLIRNIYQKYQSIYNPNIVKNQTLIPNIKDENQEKMYETIMKNEQFTMCELAENHIYYKERTQKLESKSLMRVISEISSLKTGLPLNWDSSIWLRFSKSNMNLFTFLVSGPKDTPYQDGLFEFHAYMPPGYPALEPKVLLNTTGMGKVRFNPNLYACGKVCLSLLGTWSGNEGEKWNVNTSTFLQVLVSIQSLILVDHPYFNEPGYEKTMNTEKGTLSSNEYNETIQLGTMEWAIINQIINPPHGYETVVKEHFKRKKDNILKTCSEWLNKSIKFKTKFQKVYTVLEKTLNTL
jgi:ubiquitin-protein ligase